MHHRKAFYLMRIPKVDTLNKSVYSLYFDLALVVFSHNYH